MYQKRSAARFCLEGAILGPCLDAFLPTIAFPQQATSSALYPTQLPGKGLEQHPFLSPKFQTIF